LNFSATDIYRRQGCDRARLIVLHDPASRDVLDIMMQAKFLYERILRGGSHLGIDISGGVSKERSLNNCDEISG
jgi:hypothetical protein